MKSNLLSRSMVVFPLAGLLLSHSLASGGAISVAPSGERLVEPRRIFDSERGRFVANPDYHAPALAGQRAPAPKPTAEPRRIFDPESGDFVANPAYHSRAPQGLVALRLAEPRRIFDAEKGRFVPNPAYRGVGGDPRATALHSASTHT